MFRSVMSSRCDVEGAQREHEEQFRSFNAI